MSDPPTPSTGQPPPSPTLEVNVGDTTEGKVVNPAPPASAPVHAKTIDDVVYLFGKHHGVRGVILMNRAGIIISSNMDGPATGMYAGLSKNILDAMAHPIEPLTPEKINIIRVNSCSQEVVIGPVHGEDLIFVIVQDCEDLASEASNTKKETLRSKESELLAERTKLEEMEASTEAAAGAPSTGSKHSLQQV